MLSTFLLTSTVSRTFAEDSAIEDISQDLTDTVFENVDDSNSDVEIDQSTSISTGSDNTYSDTVLNESTGTFGRVTTQAYPSIGNCGLSVYYPHPSNNNSEEIHTRIESQCKIFPLVSNSVSGKTYRSRWYGWQRVATLKSKTVTLPSSRVQRFRSTVVAKCKAGTLYRYRTEGFGTVSTGVQKFSGAAYEQNDDEIKCVKR